MHTILSTSDSSNGSQPAPLWQRVSLKQVALTTTLVALTLLAVGLLIALRYVLIMLFLGIVVATALAPVSDRLQRIGLKRGPASVIAFALLFLIAIGIIAALIPFFLSQIAGVAADLPNRYLVLRETLSSSPSSLLRSVAGQLPANPFANISSDEGLALGGIVSAQIPAIWRALLFTTLVLLLSYYWLYYRSLAIQALALLIPIDRRTGFVDLWNQIEVQIGAFVRGLALLGCVIGLLSWVGYLLIGLPYAGTIAIIAGVLEAVPYVGPFLTMLIAVIVGLSDSPTTALLSLLVAVIVQFLENAVVVPRVMDRAVGVRPVVTLLALALFTELFGLLGALLAVPLAAVVQVLLNRLIGQTSTPEETSIGGRDQLALLRYRTLDLASDLRQRVRSKTEELTVEEDAIEDELEALLVDLDTLLASEQERRA